MTSSPFINSIIILHRKKVQNRLSTALAIISYSKKLFIRVIRLHQEWVLPSTSFFFYTVKQWRNVTLYKENIEVQDLVIYNKRACSLRYSSIYSSWISFLLSFTTLTQHQLNISRNTHFFFNKIKKKKGISYWIFCTGSIFLWFFSFDSSVSVSFSGIVSVSVWTKLIIREY